MRAVLLFLVLSGCVSTAAAILEAPIKIVGAGIDAGLDTATTTQREADEDRGRALRKREEAEAKAAKRDEKNRRKNAARGYSTI